MFDPEDYLRLYNWTFGKNLTLADLPATEEPILKRLEAVQAKFDHALPAHVLTERRQEFFAAALPLTIERFAKPFQALNATIG